MAKYTKTATGIAQIAFATPKAPWDVNVTQSETVWVEAKADAQVGGEK